MPQQTLSNVASKLQPPMTNGGVKQPTMAELMAQLEAAQQENAALREAQSAQVYKLSMKVSEKGALSVYGLGRFPVTLYREQWEKLLSMADQIREFIKVHASDLTVKNR